MLRFRNLGSGSSGNATIVEARSGSRVNRLLVDCGLGIRQLDQRLQRAGLSADDIDAIFVTHEHSDHIGCARQVAMRHQIPVWMSHGTHAGVGSPDFDGLLQLARDGVAIELGELHLTPFTVPHDAREPLQLRCSDGASSLGILTDLGHATEHVLAQLAACQALLLECNHDADLLAGGAYPAFLKKRVGGKMGHLSNARAGEIARALRHPGLATVVAAHLSQHNNRPELARAALARALDCAAADIAVADQVHGSDWFTVG
ncbi:MAG: MBL fold metallo-hydrolase [Rhodoferax sp.]|nr:MBL fold metallo-hydrolase [Rhodoferax sp.]MBP9929343.1 MBL fold metallo-hydrolase [Rhodoferax sp.]HQZ06082.1 MBL fold metallo-hydrolase [Burkholderiaceae bacterium]HRA63074.1 MBL fold metallo-hydrolase [Burkholderiaceae bacterium]